MIRVAGAQSLKGLIGRSSETKAAAEVELMSSTSSEGEKLFILNICIRT